MPVNDRIQLRRGTEAQWIAAEAADADTEPLADGEPGVVVDADGVPLYLVVGDTGTEFEDLPRFSPDSALSATIGLGAGWPRRSGSTQYITDPYAIPGGSALGLTLGRTCGDWIVVPFDATITGYAFEVTTAADPGSLIRSALHQQTSVEATADLPLLHDGGTSDLSTTGVKQVTGLSIPVTAGTIIRPTLKWESGTGSPAVRAHRSPRPTQVGITTLIGGTGSGGFCVDTTTSPGPFGTVRLDGSASAAPRFALFVVAS